MGAPYGQFCPVSKAMEMLDERWTLLVIRELLSDSHRFNELRRGLPRMSPSLLSRRLQHLERSGVVRRTVDGSDVSYDLTPAGEELRPIVEGLGIWGTRWIGDLGDEDLDPHLLLWDMHRNVDAEALPTGRTVVEFDFTDVPDRQRRWWLVMTSADVDVCDSDPGYEVSVRVTGSLRSLTDVWRGHIAWSRALKEGSLVTEGPPGLRRALPDWFTLSPFAPVPRPVTN